MRAFTRRVLFTSLVALCAAATLTTRAAAQPATATISGVVTAADGARLPGVALRAVRVDSGGQVESFSSDAGVFRLGDLAPGLYDVAAELPGFDTRVSRVRLEAGDSISLPLQLEVATVRESVRVVGDAPRDSVEAFELSESRARDLGEAIAAVPGMGKLRKGAIANDIVLRGFQGKDVTVLIDGQRIDGACPGHMDPPAFHVDFAEVNRVEVSKGPFDVKNQGGLAGVVNVVTERPQRGWHGTATVAFGTADMRSASASTSAGGTRWAALGGASARRADPYRDGRGRPMTSDSGYRAGILEDVPAYDVWTGWGRIALVPRAGTTLQISYTRQSADTIVYPYLQMDAIYDNADRAGARLEIADLPGGWGGLAAHVYYTEVNHWMTDALRTTAIGRPRAYSMGTQAKTAIAGGRAELQRGRMTLGVEASRRNWNTITMLAMQDYVPRAAMPDVTMNVAGAFGTVTAAPHEAWSLEAGARVDRAATAADPRLANLALYLAYQGTTATTASDLLPTAYVRARWRHDSGWSAMSGVGHAARVPDQQERFYGVQRMGSDWVGNPALAASRNTGADGELRYTGGGLDAAVTAFFYRIADHILPTDRARIAAVPGVMNTVARSYSNVDAVMRGVEASATVPLARTLFLSADLSVVRGTARGASPDETNLPEIPPARARMRLRYDNARWNAVAEIAGASRQDRVAVQLHETATPGHAVMSVRGGLRMRRLSVTAAVDNLFDAAYAEHLSYQRDPFRNGVRLFEPGRTASLSLAARF
jgi:iron complex outermembrane recepter protein